MIEKKRFAITLLIYNMKILFSILSILLFTIINLNAQENGEMANPLEDAQHIPMSAGIFLGARAGVNANDAPLGIQNAIQIGGAPEIGGIFYLPLSKTENLGLTAELAYSTAVFTLKGYDSGKKFKNQFEYLTFAPQIFVKGFMLGFSFGAPLSGEMGDIAVSTKDMNTYVAFKIGGEIPVFEDESGRLNIFISGEYSLTKTIGSFETNIKNYDIYKESKAYEDSKSDYIKPEFKTTITQDLSPRPASLTIGFNYFFNIK